MRQVCVETNKPTPGCEGCSAAESGTRSGSEDPTNGVTDKQNQRTALSAESLLCIRINEQPEEVRRAERRRFPRRWLAGDPPKTLEDQRGRLEQSSTEPGSAHKTNLHVLLNQELTQTLNKQISINSTRTERDVQKTPTSFSEPKTHNCWIKPESGEMFLFSMRN
ncbi:hypothetical protein FQA47_015107 [Oryzias melastigma]|uniref:Uncharacterized protein n=1 Tax=Oryzias melastigma TaxID=30732 RepID=A0A834BX44_ORYME|nr:hypothetical protein FQA47_015107 [Oryzias melastigma]